MRESLSTRAKVTAAALALVVASGAALLVRRPIAQAPMATATAALRGDVAVGVETKDSPAPRARSADPASMARPGSGSEVPMDVEEALRNGSKEPLTPPEIKVNAELAPGSVFTSEPLTPPVIRLPDIELAPGSVIPSEPLVPPIIKDNAIPKTP